MNGREVGDTAIYSMGKRAIHLYKKSLLMPQEDAEDVKSRH